MEAQTGTEMGATHSDTGSGTTRAYNFNGPPPLKPNQDILVNYILRFVAFLLTFISAVVLGAAKETVILSSSTIENGVIKSTQFAAYVYLIIANVVVLIYSLASLMISIANRAVLGRFAVPLSIGDLIMVVLLYSCNGAAAAVSIISDNGQPSTGWNSICGVLNKFCASIKASIVLSMFAGVVYFLFVVFALVGTHKQLQIR
ncbi:CASP-like protein [Rhynchospora pubera]|uniref:CASP-like protein n=1 Tax=Rhynchospora pubera TaxID=906938 RepID=A0AAV8GNS3_9POAL|nr:CASP-like protein [Rhynchospora pubera]